MLPSTAPALQSVIVPLATSDVVYVLGLIAVSLLLYLVLVGLVAVTVIIPTLMWVIQQFNIFNLTRGIRDVGTGVREWGEGSNPDRMEGDGT